MKQLISVYKSLLRTTSLSYIVSETDLDSNITCISLSPLPDPFPAPDSHYVLLMLKAAIRPVFFKDSHFCLVMRLEVI